MNTEKNFVVSTADFALYYNDILACTGTTNLNSSIEVSMQEQNVTAGKGGKKILSYKYGRELNVTLETANWSLEYIACQVGKEISVQLADLYKIGECVTVNEGIAVLPTIPVGDVACEFNGNIVTVTPDGNTIDLTKFNVSGKINVTYKYRNMAKTLIIDSESSPNVFKLVLDADRHNNKIGKVGSVQIVIPSYQPSGNFNIEFTPDGVTSINIDGTALAVEGDTCEAGNAVYAYINEFDDTESAIIVSEIAATPAEIELNTTDSQTSKISVIGLKGSLYSPIELENTDCTFVSDSPTIATIDEDGIVTAISTGNAKITVNYNGVSDELNVIVS